MNTNIKTIRFTIKMSIVLALLTYSISLNISFDFFDIKWLSNTFLITILGGAFASMIVVLICECQKYYLNKRETENSLFFHVGQLYGHLLMIKLDIEEQLANKNETVSKNLIKIPADRAKFEIDLIQNIEYIVFSKKNNIALQHREFCSWCRKNILAFLRNQYCLAIAINDDQLYNLDTYHQEYPITSENKNTNRALKIMYNEIPSLIDGVDAYLKTIDSVCENRYSWDKTKKSIISGWKQLPNDMYADFIKQEAEK